VWPLTSPWKRRLQVAPSVLVLSPPTAVGFGGIPHHRPDLVRVHLFVILDVGTDVAYSASKIDSATLEIDSAMRISGCDVDLVLSSQLEIRRSSQ